jgi:membrane dipeptidase
MDESGLHERAIVIDGCSFWFTGMNERIRSSGTTAIIFTVPYPLDDLAEAVTRVKDYYEIVRADPLVDIVWRAADIERLKSEGRFGVIIGAQDSRFIGTDLGLVAVFEQMGLRVMQLTYNERNFMGDGCMEPENGGLSHLGMWCGP